MLLQLQKQLYQKADNTNYISAVTHKYIFVMVYNRN